MYTLFKNTILYQKKNNKKQLNNNTQLPHNLTITMKTNQNKTLKNTKNITTN